MLFSLDGHRVVCHPEAFVAHNATVIGRVELKRAASVWFNVVVRGDNDAISIGEGSNVQDGSVLHADPGYRLTIGDYVSIGHKAMVHGCTIGDGSLIGISSVVLNGARIGKHCLIGANALVAEHKEIPDRSLVVGAPGRIIRSLSDEEVENLMDAARNYVRKIKLYRDSLEPDTHD